MFRIFDIVWDTNEATDPGTLPNELIIGFRVHQDPEAFKLRVMDFLDTEYRSIVETFKWEEI